MFVGFTDWKYLCGAVSNYLEGVLGVEEVLGV